MNSDFRIATGFFDHIKTLRLEQAAGPGAIVALLRLWCWTAVHHPEGDWRFTALDIASAARWTGDPGVLVEHLVLAGYLDVELRAEGPLYRLHDWSDNQPWCVGARKRRELARLAGRASACKRSISNATLNRPLNDPSTDRSTPSPSPTPESSPETSSPPKTPPELKPGSRYSPGFLSLWSIAPKGSKKRAYDAWRKLKLEKRAAELVAVYRRQLDAKTQARKRGEFVAEQQDTERWLRNRRWEDQLPAQAAPGRARDLQPGEARRIRERYLREIQGNSAVPVQKVPGSGLSDV